MTIEPIHAGDELAANIAEAAGDDLAAIVADIEHGRAGAYRVNGGECYIVLRIDSSAHRREMVVVCAQGEGIADIAERIVADAKAQGCDRVRWHSQRPALARLIGQRLDVREIETVFAVEC